MKKFETLELRFSPLGCFYRNFNTDQEIVTRFSYLSDAVQFLNQEGWQVVGFCGNSNTWIMSRELKE